MWADASCARPSSAVWGLPYREIAQELTNHNLPTPRGGEQWNAMSVMRVMKRLGIAGE
jgi:hypothetical protein